MKYLLLIIGFILTAFGCSNDTKKSVKNDSVQIDSVIINKQLERMVKSDQDVQFAHKPNQSEKIRDSLYKEQGRIFESNTDTIQQIYKKYGFLGFDKVGKKASQNFWLLVQHADHKIDFQEEVLNSMIIEVERKNADATNYAYLMDRVLKNKGKKQLYGTQVRYVEDFWVVPQPLQDSINVNKRRKEVGLSTIEDYLNNVMELHFEMNKTIYEKNDLQSPRKYENKP